jgi:cell division protein FtsB
VYSKERESRSQRIIAEAELKELSERKDRIYTDIKSLETDRGKEEALRSQYEIGKEGEGLIIIVDEESSTTTATTTEKLWYQKAFWWW